MKNEIIEKFTILITSAFGLAAALAWNEAIQEILTNYGLEKYGLWLYAVIVTVIAVIITLVLGWISEKTKKINLPRKKRRR